MRLATLTRVLFLTPIVLVALVLAAPSAQATCEFHGSPQAGNIDCVRWAEDETPGTGEQPPGADAGTSQADHAGSGTAAAPVCRDDRDTVVPCTTVNENGTTCYYSGTIGATPDGSGGGAFYICPAENDGADPNEPPGPGGEVTAPADPVVLTWRAVASLGLRSVDMEIAPAPLSADDDSMGLVGLPVWLSSTDSPATWGPQTGSASDGPVAVMVTARVERVEWDMGDGTIVTCRTPGTAYDPSRHVVDDHSPDCGHVYDRTSRNQPGGVYTVTATSYWTAEWTADTGASGTIPFELTSSEQIRIGEMQVLRTSSGD